MSCAYYAVFHALCEAITAHIVKADDDRVLYTSLYRTWEHARLGRALQGLRDHPDLRALGTLFDNLKARREKADYDPFWCPEAGDVLEQIGLGTQALSFIESMSANDRVRLVVEMIRRSK